MPASSNKLPRGFLNGGGFRSFDSAPVCEDLLEAGDQLINVDGFLHITGCPELLRPFLGLLPMTDRHHDHRNVAQPCVAFKSLQDVKPIPPRATPDLRGWLGVRVAGPR